MVRGVQGSPFMRMLVLAPALLLCRCGGAAVEEETVGPGPTEAGVHDSQVTEVVDAPDANDGSTRRQVAEAYCSRVFKCKPILASALYPDAAACVTQYKAEVDTLLSEPGVGYGAAEWLKCELARGALDCNDLWMHLQLGEPQLPECVLPTGTIANSPPCLFDEQCQSGRCGIGGPCGICLAAGVEGELCNQAWAPCAVGLACTPIPSPDGPSAARRTR